MSRKGRLRKTVSALASESDERTKIKIISCTRYLDGIEMRESRLLCKQVAGVLKAYSFIKSRRIVSMKITLEKKRNSITAEY